MGEAQLSEQGEVATPDFVFEHDVLINEVPVKWVEAKCYYASGGTCPLQQARDVKQASRYSSRWGPGAFVYARGISAEASKILGVPVFDAAAALDFTHEQAAKLDQ